MRRNERNYKKQDRREETRNEMWRNKMRWGEMRKDKTKEKGEEQRRDKKWRKKYRQEETCKEKQDRNELKETRWEEKWEKLGEEIDLRPFCVCCGFDRTVVFLGCVKFCPRVTVTPDTSVFPAGGLASADPTASASAGWHTPERETR